MTDHTNNMAPFEIRVPDADPAVYQMLNTWRRIRHGELVPLKSDFDPMTVPRLLGSVWLYAFDPAQGDFICRLAGEEINAAWGQNISGMSARQVIGEKDHPVVLERWKRIINVPAVHYGTRSERLSALKTYTAERLIVPLIGTKGGPPDHVLGLSLYDIAQPDPKRAPLRRDDSIQIPCSEI